MSLIKCVECGNNISSFATACPICGCPAEKQNRETDRTTHELRNIEKWDNIAKLVKEKEIFGAIDEIKAVLNTKSLSAANEIYVKIRDTGELPIDFILEKFPDQATQPIIKKPEATTKPCSACGKTISVKAETCPHCGQPTGVHVCPRCGSTDVVYIDGVSKAASMMLFGIFSVNTVRNKYECWECHFKF